MSATQDLRSEHVGVGEMLDIMNGMADRLDSGERVDASDLAGVIEFLRVFVDQCHHSKEEQLLFPALRAAKVTAAEETLNILMEDHAQGRETSARIAAAADRPEELTARAELAAAMAEYTKLLRAHIIFEENYCFDVADHELPAPVQDELVEGYERIEREVVGEGRHEAFHALLGRLSLAYLE